MPNNKAEQVIKEAIFAILRKSADRKELLKSLKKHQLKPHFIPIRYRVLGGILQSLNIKFGNYIENLILELAKFDDHIKPLNPYSGNKNVKLGISSNTEALIDKYISDCQYKSEVNLEDRFSELVSNIIESENKYKIKQPHKGDVDFLFEDVRDGKVYFFEIKYNDDHDTGKFVDINRKLIKTYAGLLNLPEIQDRKQDLHPYLFFFTNKKMKGNIYLPEETNILRGKNAFDKFFSIKYKEVEEGLLNIGKNEEIISIFDGLYKEISNLETKTNA